ncbi:hypothetical protein Q0P45_14340, partial [Staphylococcus aureus]|nr:hypothetical protein [Staphylococcus aureus]
YLICGMLVIVKMIISLLKKPTPRPANSL